MMTDELILMLNKFEVGTGKAPTKILCGEEAFEKLRIEATDDWGADRYLEPNINIDGYVARFMGIPIQVIHNQNVLDGNKIYVISEPEDAYRPIGGGHWWVRNQDYDKTNDYVAKFDMAKYFNDAFATHYYGRWDYDNVESKRDDEEVEIDDHALMSVLNGGGFSAVA